jgi:TRAP transporter TAXI family solute receptor
MTFRGFGPFCFGMILFTAAAASVSAETPATPPTAQSASAVKAKARPWADPTAEINANTVTIISGNPNGTYLTIAYDISAVLDNGDKLRVLPVVGKGGAQNLRDILYLKGVDMGIVQSDALRYFQESKEAGQNIEQRLRFVAKLYNEEVHILARPEISSLTDLAGKAVNFSDNGSGSQLTARFLFRDLGIKVREVNMGQADAIEKMKAGEVAATFLVAGKPTTVFAGLKDNTANFKFLPLPYNPSLPVEYLPTTLTSKEYPNLIKEGADVETVAIGAVLAVFNWAEGSDRYRRVASFVDAFFRNIEKFRQRPRHVKWQETNLAAEVPGWTRFAAAKQLLDKQAADEDAKLKNDFRAFLATQKTPEGKPLSTPEQDALFAKFKQWQQTR